MWTQNRVDTDLRRQMILTHTAASLNADMEKYVKVLLAITLVVASSAVSAATYEVVPPSAKSQASAKLIEEGRTTCMHASVPVALGDTLKLPDGKRFVCASGEQGPLFLPVADMH